MKRKLQVFVSSTYTDLMDERQAAVVSILKAGHIPAGMELFTAGDRSQMATIKKWIDESDVYMLVLGGRYGSIEPTTGISYTELEYDYAVEQKKPLFSVVITEVALEAKIRGGGSRFGEKDNPKQLRMFREKVLCNVSSFFEDPKDIRLCVHESLADMAMSRDLKGWVSADAVVDTKPLFDEIQKLSEENQQLKNALAEQESRVSRKTYFDGSFSEIREVLKAIEVKVPANVSELNADVVKSLLDLFYLNKDAFLTGVTNSVGVNAVNRFFYHSVCPKLQVHGLAANEKVAGVQYRRYSITPLGIKFLADEDRLRLLSKPNEVQSSPPKSRPGATAASSPVLKKDNPTKQPRPKRKRS